MGYEIAGRGAGWQAPQGKGTLREASFHVLFRPDAKNPVLPVIGRLCLRAAATGLALSSSSLAQASAEATLQEIVVTGERLQRHLSETASSVVVTTGEMNEALAGADRVDQSDGSAGLG